MRLSDYEVSRTLSAPPPDQWALRNHGIRRLWESIGTKGEGARVAVIDTGVNTSHPDLRGVKAHDYTGDGPEDRNGHGTHCCGIVGASASGPVSGVAPGCELHSFKVFNDAGACRNSWIVAALQDVKSGRRGRFDVVSMSLGAQAPSEQMRMLLLEMSAMGIVVLAAAGNDGRSEGSAPGEECGSVDWPAAFSSTVAVGSTDAGRRRSAFSSTGDKLVVTAPGKEITNCWVGPDAYATISGTSMACPFAAGCVALLVSHARARGLPPPRLDSVTYCLAASAVDIDRPGYDLNTGHGDINPAGFVRAYERLVSGR